LKNILLPTAISVQNRLKIETSGLRPDLTDFFTVQSIKRCIEPLLRRTDKDKLLITLDDFSSPFSLRKEKSPSLYFQESAVTNDRHPLTCSRDKPEIYNSKRGHGGLKLSKGHLKNNLASEEKKFCIVRSMNFKDNNILW